MDKLEKTHVIALVRTATTRQQQCGSTSIENQKVKITNFADKNNIAISKWVEIAGVRANFLEVLELCKNKPNIKHLIVSDITRISRSLEDLIDWRKGLKPLGVSIIAIDTHRINRFVENEFLQNLRIVLAEQEVKHKSERIKRASPKKGQLKAA